MSRRKTGHNKRKLNDHLPEHICKGFEEELTHLIDEMAHSDCPKRRYLASEYKSKYVGEDTAPEHMRREAAIAKWLAAEKRNFTTNQRIIFEEEDTDFGWTTATRLLTKAGSIVRDVLGEYESTSWSDGSFSNGASTRVKRAATAAISKHSGKAHISSDALGRWMRTISGTTMSFQGCVRKDSSVLFTVPKSTDIDRVACKEPEANMFMQREAGMFIRNRLKRVGIDLLDQTKNQQMAARAYRDGLATIDLSSASDTISTALVHRLLPYDWFSLLDDLRVKTVEIEMELGSSEPPVLHELSMFSSMGNGFTFELESLIFYALTRAVCWLSGVKGEVSVYGDDIICTSLIGRRLARVFNWLGFTVNSKKSNWSGTFRESCGKHFHKSWDITPFYLRKPISCKTDVIRVLNRLLQWSSENTGVIIYPEVAAFHYKWGKAAIPNVLHGGEDPEMDSVLVTGRAPYQGSLVRKTEACTYDENVALVWWLTTKRSSPFEAMVCNPTEVTEVVFEPYHEHYHTRVWCPWRGKTISKKVDKIGWQRPSYKHDIYGLFIPKDCEPTPPSGEIGSNSLDVIMKSWTEVAREGLLELTLPENY